MLYELVVTLAIWLMPWSWCSWPWQTESLLPATWAPCVPLSLLQIQFLQGSMRESFWSHTVPSLNMVMRLEKQVVISPAWLKKILYGCISWGDLLRSLEKQFLLRYLGGWCSPIEAIPWPTVTRLIFCPKDSCLPNHPKTTLWDQPIVLSDLAQGSLAWLSSRIFILGSDFQGQHMDMKQSSRHTVLGMHTHMLELTESCAERH